MSNTIVEYFGGGDGHRCGYCGGKTGNLSHGMWAHHMTVQDYEDLICRGWRRSGKYCYKPLMNKTCCPHYTIRCLVEDFKMSKNQKSTLKQVHRYFNEGKKPGEKTEVYGNAASSSKTNDNDLEMSTDDLQPATAKSDLKPATVKERHEPKKGEGADPNKPKCRKAKEIRKEKAKLKHPEKVSNVHGEKSLQDFVSELKPGGFHSLEIKLVRSSPRSEEFDKTFKDEFRVYKKYQTVIHNDKPGEVSEKQFTRFLIDSPLIAEHNNDGINQGYGSFHQQYWIDGKLWMVGVIDILPTATSSVYLFYDPDFSFLSPGTYSALREIEFTQKLHSIQPKIYSYMMGYYIHTCHKMKYKGQYDPSFLLCPEAATWIPIKDCVPKLEASKYCRLAAEGVEDEEAEVEVDKVLVLHQQTAMPYGVYQMMKTMKSGRCTDQAEVEEYSRLVGRTCAQRMLLYRQ